MNIEEYNKIKEYSYNDYCNYLQIKYGKIHEPYFKNSNCSTPNKKIKRYSDGLFIHHIREDTIPNLSDKYIAQQNSWDYQQPKNLVYCDYLEHLLLHILICKEYTADRENQVGIGGIIYYILPELEILYNQNVLQTENSKNIYLKVINDKDVYEQLKDEFFTNRTIQLNYNITEEELKQITFNRVYEQNKFVFNQLDEMLDNYNSALVLLGTGMGKTNIGLAYISKYKIKGLVLCPNKTIQDGWSKYSTVDAMTYQSFMHKNIDLSNYGVLICDEVHHLGNNEWSKPIEYIIQNNLIKVIGLTATDKRTDGINVGKTLFNNNICEGFDVLEGIENNILHPFSYVGAYYDSSNIKQNILEKYKDKELDMKLIGELDLEINNTPTVKEILLTNMPKGKRKGIIFVSTIEAIPEAMTIMKDVFPNIIYKYIHSKLNTQEINSIRQWFKNTDEGYLIVIDMISEGAHYKGVNTIIMLRRTCSALLFQQQIGRIITPTKFENPNAIVFDLVNNSQTIQAFTKISKKLKEIINKKQVVIDRASIEKSDQLIYRDYTCGIEDILKQIKDSVYCCWTKEEDDILKKYYLVEGAKVIYRLKNRSKQSIYVRASELGIKCKNPNKWTKEEDEILRKHYPMEGPKGCQKYLPNRTSSKCSDRARKLGIKYENPNKWTKEEDNILRKYYSIEGEKVGERITNHTSKNCQQRAIKLGIKRENYHWTTEEINLLKKYYHIGGVLLAKNYLEEKTNEQIASKASILHLKSPNSKPKKVICIETHLIYPSASEAMQQTNFTTIDTCCRGKCHTAGGYHWMYLEEYNKKQLNKE